MDNTTLLIILIVVIILGILAAIVIPQFTNASIDAKHSSVQSTVQTVRSQVALYSLQHGDTVPAAADLWTEIDSSVTSPLYWQGITFDATARPLGGSPQRLGGELPEAFLVGARELAEVPEAPVERLGGHRG